MKTTPMIKGLIAGILMVAAHLAFYYGKVPNSSPLTYLVYVLYAGGLVWTLRAYYSSPDYKPQFGAIFSQGFRYFIVVTLVMVCYIFIFIKTHPQMAEDTAQLYREDLVKQGSKSHKTPEDIEQAVQEFKDSFTASWVSITMFSQLLMGVLFTAAGAGFLLMRKK
ncbi:MAG TPA: DUF4199 domain-containing protein [Chitinophagaceae bacterium]|nr:DUF4199 domain-containing protein [Chitinophagaceae bacterium]